MEAAILGLQSSQSDIRNQLKGYCDTMLISLRVYYERQKQTLQIIPGRDIESKIITYDVRQRVNLSVPNQIGYTFGGWKLERNTGTVDSGGNEIWEEWTDGTVVRYEDGSVSFAMPNLPLRATGIWNPAPFDQTILYYFQDVNHTYPREQMAVLLSAAKETGRKVQVGTQIFENGTWYYSDEGKTRMIGISLVLDGIEYYYSGGTQNGDTMLVENADLLGARRNVTVTSDDRIAVSTYLLPASNGIFNFAYMVYQTRNEVSNHGTDDTVTAVFGMSMEYYYQRKDGLMIDAEALATDGGESGATLVGTGSHMYGEQVELKANLAEGYEFVGWYRKEDVCDAEWNLKSDWAAAVKLSEEVNYSLRVRSNENLVAVTRPRAIAEASVTISGKDAYVYGYSQSKENVLTASVTFAAGASEANYVVGYQWYQVNGEEKTPISGAVSAVWTFPTGKDAGTYHYQCEVTCGRKDNGRTKKIWSGPYQVSVSSSSLQVEVIDYNGIYDGAAHTIQVKVDEAVPSSEYTIYYSTEPITAENLNRETMSAIPSYTDVKETIVDGETTIASYPVYFYVDYTGAKANYQDYAGHGLVTIQPKEVSIKAASGVFGKFYDGNAEIPGGFAEERSEQGRLAIGLAPYFQLEGLLGDTSGTLLGFDAAFNSKDVAAASTVTLSNLYVADSSGTRNPNYVFPGGVTLTLSGYIDPYELAVTWGTTAQFIYDGTPHAPSAALVGSIEQGEYEPIS